VFEGNALPVGKKKIVIKYLRKCTHHHHHASLRTTALEEPATHPLNLSLNINKLK